MINLVIPIAGNAQRFRDAGYLTPKPAIEVGDLTILERSLYSLEFDLSRVRLIFITRQEHNLGPWLSMCPNSTIIEIEELTDGTLSTCLLAKEYINNQDPLFIYTPDVCHSKTNLQAIINKQSDGDILTFKANNPAHSYALKEDERVIRTAEKCVISNDAAVGLYYFARGSDFIEHAERMVANNERVNGEFYLCPVYNSMIKEGATVTTTPVDSMHVLGTPEDVKFFEKHVLQYAHIKFIAVCSDHSGYDLKNSFKKYVPSYIHVLDLGTYHPGPCDHHDYLQKVFDFDFPFLLFCFCATGQAFNIAVNKIPGRRSALVWNAHTAEMAVAHNAANAFCIPALYVKEEQVADILHNILNAGFQGGRHTNRIMKFEQDERFQR